MEEKQRKQLEEAIKRVEMVLRKLQEERRINSRLIFQPFGPKDGSGDWQKHLKG